LALRGLRDNFKRRLMYITTSRSTPDEIAEQRAKELEDEAPGALFVYEGFVELFRETTRFLDLLDEQSIYASMDRYMKRRDMTLKPHEKLRLGETLRDITGGHVGLLRRSFEPTVHALRHRLDALETALADEAVLKECWTIYRSLPDAQQEALKRIAHGADGMDPRAVQGLVNKKLVQVESDGRLTIRERILHEFMCREFRP
jgi:hypothetical protein